jgi:hypothetical protein
MTATLTRRGAVQFMALVATAFAAGTPSAIAQDAPVAIKGYDPVAYFTLSKPTRVRPSSPTIGTIIATCS